MLYIFSSSSRLFKQNILNVKILLNLLLERLYPLHMAEVATHNIIMQKSEITVLHGTTKALPNHLGWQKRPYFPWHISIAVLDFGALVVWHLV